MQRAIFQLLIVAIVAWTGYCVWAFDHTNATASNFLNSLGVPGLMNSLGLSPKGSTLAKEFVASELLQRYLQLWGTVTAALGILALLVKPTPK